jgi:CheY-like chemotaxis protein
MKFLVVDDEKDWRDMISRWLNHLSIIHDTAENGFEAIRLLQMGGYTHVTVDLYMPRMDGLTLCRYIKEHFEVIVIVLTNHPDVGKLLDTEIRYKFPKPTKLDEFESIIKKAIA